MTCDRCQGCLVRDLINRRGLWWLRCLNCGERIDGAILHHRAEQDAAAAAQRAAVDRDCIEWARWFARIPT